MTVATIRERLRSRRPATVGGSGGARAAVAVVLREAAPGLDFIVIQRSHREGDPWSGHMALPGGRQDPADRDLFMTAVRETREEVGIDLEHDSELLGGLDELRAMGKGQLLDLVITPYVYALTSPVTLSPNQHEVQSALWVPLSFLRQRTAQGIHRHSFNGRDTEHQAFIYQGHVIWGLTYRILSQLLDILPKP